MDDKEVVVSKTFVIPRKSELAKCPVDFRFKVNLYYTTLIIEEIVVAHHEKNSELPKPFGVRFYIDVMIEYKPDYLIEVFLTNSFRYWKEIAKENTQFFINQGHIVFSLPSENVGAFKAIFERNLLTPTRRNDLWKYLAVMIKQCIRYLHQKIGNKDMIIIREKDDDGNPNKNAAKFTKADVAALIKEYNIDLTK